METIERHVTKHIECVCLAKAERVIVIAHHNHNGDAGGVQAQQTFHQQALLRGAGVGCFVCIAGKEKKIDVLFQTPVDAEVQCVIKIKKTRMNSRLLIYFPVIFDAEVNIGSVNKLYHLFSVMLESLLVLTAAINELLLARG